MATILSIDKTYERHHTENPKSNLSKKAIRDAVKTGKLSSIKSGNKSLICFETFNNWLIS